MEKERKGEVRLPYEGELDRVTSLPPRSVLDRHLPVLLADMGARHLPLCAVMIDIDHFKRFNDTWGHGVGDRVLGHVAGLIRRSVFSRGEAYRYGGEEITVLLHNTSSPEGLAMAWRLVSIVSGSPLLLDPGDPAVALAAPGGSSEPLRLGVTISAGVCSTGTDVKGAELIVMADHALLKAKTSGRNRAEEYTPELGLLVRRQIIDVRYPGNIDLKENSSIIVKAWFPLRKMDITSIEARDLIIEDSGTREMVTLPAQEGAILGEIPGRVVSVERRQDRTFTFLELEIKSDVVEVMIRDAEEHQRRIDRLLAGEPALPEDGREGADGSEPDPP